MSYLEGNYDIHPLTFLAIRRVMIFLAEWIYYYFLLNIISHHQEKGWIPRLILVLWGIYMIREYYLLGLLEQAHKIYQEKNVSLAYLAFRQIAVTLDLICSLKLIYWLHYEVKEEDWLVIGFVWLGTITFNTVGVYYLKYLETSQGIYDKVNN